MKNSPRTSRTLGNSEELLRLHPPTVEDNDAISIDEGAKLMGVGRSAATQRFIALVETGAWEYVYVRRNGKILKAYRVKK